MTIKIYKNFLDEKDYKNLQAIMLNNYFPWYITPIIDDIGIESDHYKNSQFTHNFYDDYLQRSNYFNLVTCFLNKLKPKALIRIKANLLNRTNKKIIHGMHTDTKFKCNTAVYYVNSNNGETIFENGKKVQSKENTLVVFPSQLKHSGTTHTCNSAYRVVININYF